jgi:hypothetical protein
MHRWVRVAMVPLLALGLIALPALAASPIKVRDAARIKEWGGSAIDGWSAWEANTEAHPAVFKVSVRPDGGSVQRIPMSGTTRVGDLITSGPRAGQIVFQASDLRKGDIRFYDPVGDTVHRAPKGINTNAREEFPEAEGDYLVFDRTARAGWKTILYRFGTKTSTIIGRRMRAGQLNGDYAALWSCTKTTCDVRRYRISTARFIKVPGAPPGTANYWPAVMGDGTLYYVRGSFSRCGRGTKILSFSHATGVTTIAKLPNGTDLAAMEARTVGGVDQLLVTEITCGPSGSITDTGIYAVAI